MKTLLAALAIPAAVLVAPPAGADAASYQQYIRDHQINTGIMAMSPGSEMEFGLNVCNYLRSGMTVEQVTPMGWNTMADNPAMISAAQQELCPDTLH